MSVGNDKPSVRTTFATSLLDDQPTARWLLRFCGLALILLTWQLWASSQTSILIPDVISTAQAVVDLFVTGTIFGPLWLSNQSMVIGFLIAAIMGVVIGLAMARFPKVESFIDAYVTILMVTPIAAVIVMIVMALGFGLASRVAVVIMFTLPFVIVHTRAGIRSISPSLMDAAKTYGASELQVWRKVLWPGSLPAIASGLRLGLSRAVEGMVVAELLLLAVGVGELLILYQARFQAAYLFAVIIVILIEVTVVFAIGKWLESRATPWLRH